MDLWKIACVLIVVLPSFPGRAEPGKPYRLESVDIKQRIIWGGEAIDVASGRRLAFGGQDQDAEDGRPHTRIWIDGQWLAIDDELRAKNPLQGMHGKTWDLRNDLKDLRARMRHLYFEGRARGAEAEAATEEFFAMQEALGKQLDNQVEVTTRLGANDYAIGQVARALQYVRKAGALIDPEIRQITPRFLQGLRVAQVQAELAAEALDAEPAARAVDCGRRPGDADGAAGGKGLVYDAVTGLYVLFGGDHLDYLTNDTWVFDPGKRQWFQRHPEGAPPPRANHRMESLGDGRVRLTGGYTYASNTDYLGGQYCDLDDGPWSYDVANNSWSGGALVPPDRRTYRTGPFHPDYYLQGDPPDAEKFDQVLRSLPVNTWVSTEPPFRPRLNRDWGMAVIDPDRDLMLRWSGGHSAHGGTDVPHYHFATNRWELPFPVEFPLGQLYSNTSYPNGFNFNRRPWMTGHTYQNYQYDRVSKLMVKAGRPRHHYLYDPVVGDWVGRGDKPQAVQYNSCFYTLTLVSTLHGIICWDKNGRVHRFAHGAADGNGEWIELELRGEKLPGAVVDNSTIAYDSKRDRVLMVTKPYGKAPFEGQVWSLDLKTKQVSALSPAGMEKAHRFAYIDRCMYDPESDLVLMASYFTASSNDVTPTPAFDCAENRWVTLDLDYATGKRGERVTRAFPHGRSCGIMFDAKRGLIWGTDTDSNVYVLRLEVARAGVKPL